MTPPSKTLLVDIGGTLLTRSRPGPFTRAAQVLAGYGIDTADAAVRLTLARCLLTGNERDDAVEQATAALGLSADASKALAEVLGLPEGDAVILPGAESLLRQATDAGWRVVAVTNAARWSLELPPALVRYLDATLSSADLGLLKQDPAFWTTIRRLHRLDPRYCLMVGDSPDADGTVPAGQGFCTLVQRAGDPALAEIGEWFGCASDPPDEVAGMAAGRSVRWAGQHIVEVGHLASLVASVTRFRVRASVAGRRPVTTVIVRRRYLAPALLLPTPAESGALVWLAPVGERRSSLVPADLHRTLTDRGLTLDRLSDVERRHLVSMVREARDGEVRQMRINDVVSFLRRTANQRGGASD